MCNTCFPLSNMSPHLKCAETMKKLPFASPVLRFDKEKTRYNTYTRNCIPCVSDLN